MNNQSALDSMSFEEKKAAEQIGFLEKTSPLSEAEFDALETRLRLRANVKGWTGDPLRQPATDILQEVQAILGARRGSTS